MIKANEIRIGNYLLIPECPTTDPEMMCPEQLCKVEAIGYYRKSKGLYVYFDGGDIAKIGDEYGPVGVGVR